MYIMLVIIIYLKPKCTEMILYNRFLLRYNASYKGLFECWIC
ncbi:hypothetical protein CLV25_10911 [Acetobacteroides hydrogenigenes]|uniref:Uncharacterized protein n=1 Tax=Acetobacteroides hydrogenigenes TaxID=979970 RepID=A0A4R2EH41_9BACT|nr:hypothetical protein CLV25_10911 [Acetobacteroides hydrogenigenes]